MLLVFAGAWSRVWAGSKATRWLINPVVDLLLPCGGLVWLVLTASVTIFPAFQSPTGISAQTTALLAGALLLTDTHFGAGFIRTFRHHYNKLMWPIWGPVLLIVITAAIVGHSEAFTILACKCYLFVVVLHYGQQSLSLLLTYARINEYSWDGKSKWLLTILIYGVAARVLVAQLVDPSLNVNQFLGLAMPVWTPAPEWMLHFCEAATTIAAVGAGAVIFKRAAVDKQRCPLPFYVLLVNVLIVFTYLGSLSGLLWMFVPAFFHGAQSVAEAIAANREKSPRNTIALLGSSFALGAAIMWIVPTWLPGLGVPPSLAYPCLVVGASFWHFYCEYSEFKINSTIQ